MRLKSSLFIIFLCLITNLLGCGKSKHSSNGYNPVSIPTKTDSDPNVVEGDTDQDVATSTTIKADLPILPKDQEITLDQLKVMEEQVQSQKKAQRAILCFPATLDEVKENAILSLPVNYFAASVEKADFKLSYPKAIDPTLPSDTVNISFRRQVNLQDKVTDVTIVGLTYDVAGQIKWPTYAGQGWYWKQKIEDESSGVSWKVLTPEHSEIVSWYYQYQKARLRSRQTLTCILLRKNLIAYGRMVASESMATKKLCKLLQLSNFLQECSK